MKPEEIIKLAGGTAEVARMCKVSMPAVSQWKHNGIPDLQKIIIALYLEQKGIAGRNKVLPKDLQELFKSIN